MFRFHPTIWIVAKLETSRLPGRLYRCHPHSSTMEAALPRSPTWNKAMPEDRRIPNTIVRSMPPLEFLEDDACPCGAGHPGKTGSDELMAEGGNAHH